MNANKVTFFEEYDKKENAGQVLRGSSGLSHLQILEGRVERKRKIGRPKRTRMDDIVKWTQLGTYDIVKKTAEERKKWKLIVVNLRFEDDT